MTNEQFLALPLVRVSGTTMAGGLAVTFLMHEGFDRPTMDLVQVFAKRLADVATRENRLGWLKKVAGNRDNPFNSWPTYGVVERLS